MLCSLLHISGKLPQQTSLANEFGLGKVACWTKPQSFANREWDGGVNSGRFNTIGIA
jgi:hypothetical protein